jgi:uncharacterized protein YecT (DUF1311 family)
MRDCYQAADARYEAALHAAYTTALAHLDAASAARLRQSQASWIAYRKDVRALMQAPWQGDRGTIVPLLMHQSENASLKARILEIDLVWPGFALGDEPLQIGSGTKK